MSRRELVVDHLGNEYESLLEMCEKYNVSSATFLCREKKGLSLEECLKGEKTNKHLSFAKERVGTRVYLKKYNQYGTCIEYISCGCVTIKLDDGSIGRRKNYNRFLDGVVFIPEYYEGKSWTQKNGMQFTITKYRNKHDCDGVFEDGTVRTNVDFREVKRGGVANPNCNFFNGISANEYMILYFLKPYGFKKLEKYNDIVGAKEIDIYHEDKKIAIEYDGYGHNYKKDHEKNVLCQEKGVSVIRIREKRCESFDDGISYNIQIKQEIKHPTSDAFKEVVNELIVYLNENFDFKIPFIKSMPNKKFKEHLTKIRHSSHKGEVRTMLCGINAKIIAWRDYSDIDVEFSDGTIVENKTYNNFRYRNISYPNLTKAVYMKNYIGTKRTMLDGTIATVLDSDVVTCRVLVDNEGKEVELDLLDYLDGYIDPSTPISDRTKYVGERRMMKCGLEATIVSAFSYNDIKVKFSDGLYRRTTYGHFSDGCVGHPDSMM